MTKTRRTAILGLLPITKKTQRKRSKSPIQKALKPTKTIKKVQKKTAGSGKPDTNTSKILELGLLLDCTGSMYSWIQRAKDTLNQIIENVVKSCDGKLKVRVCFLGYRDHKDTKRFDIHPFTENI